MDKQSVDYLNSYIDLTDDIKKKIDKHAKRYGIRAEICAWYQD